MNTKAINDKFEKNSEDINQYFDLTIMKAAGKIIPATRLRRELRKWLNYLEAHPMEVIIITVNNQAKGTLMSRSLHDEYKLTSQNL